MFLTLLIGGEDKGQVRQGLIGVSAEPAKRHVVSAAVAPKPAPKPKATLANFTPVTVQAPLPAMKSGTSVIAGSFVIVGQAKVETVAAVVNEADADALPVMYVSSNSVNVRGGPSTDYEVVGRLVRAEAVTVMEPAQDGWVRIAIEGDGLEGFIAARLLSDTDPAAN
ncbi:SH3 domain-containing protein [Pseudorhodobacter ferrugineus]|uniref:SH3 domain-containing protein n=1 Tax=Pseudorhodobacter ferrugineus TaxID=77008 RepID=UPI00041C29CD|nr:SH3 domain-containing protein [Pseudorhodobacter ferrugineus]